MAKKTVRAELALLRDDWFIPVQETAIEKALIYIGAAHGLDWREAARRALEETYAEFSIQGLSVLAGAQKSIEAG